MTCSGGDQTLLPTWEKQLDEIPYIFDIPVPILLFF